MDPINWNDRYATKDTPWDSGEPSRELARIIEQGLVKPGRTLELGCGTGFFLLNLMQGGVAKSGSVTDLSPGMVKVALRNAENLGLDVDGRVADAETIPYEDNTFDLVVGHAVLHHIPDVEQSLREVLRVLKPGGRFVFAGEPSTIGNAYARLLGREELFPDRVEALEGVPDLGLGQDL